jgi:hypothetical protein
MQKYGCVLHRHGQGGAFTEEVLADSVEDARDVAAALHPGATVTTVVPARAPRPANAEIVPLRTRGRVSAADRHAATAQMLRRSWKVAG